MRPGLIGAGLFGLAMAASSALPLSAQQRPQPNLSPEDQLAPSQIAQPIPPRASDPATAPKPSAAAPAPRATAAPASPTPSTSHAAKPRAATGRTVVECSGPFAKDSGMLALAMAYDARNMTFTQEDVQGTKVGVTVLFPKDPRKRLEVWWSNPNRTGTYLIDIAGQSTWTGPDGLRLGLTLEQLQKLNKKPFKVKGFDSNQLATVSDWDGGALGSLAGGCKAGVTVHVAKKGDAELPSNQEFTSDDATLRALKPAVSEILIGY